jgi:SAM-dependent methyltransferase
MHPKQIVAQGYDAIAERYAEWAGRTRTDERERYTAVLLNALPPGARVLELGCGVGVPTTQRLARRFAVTGVDISAQHIALARRNVPAATFVQADMAALDFPPAGFDAVAAFYSIIHVPREEHAALLHDIATWLRPGGLLVAAMGAGSTQAAVEQDWLGVPMYFSHFDSATNQRLVEDAGFEIISAREETADEDGVPVTFVWVVARKP